MNLKVHKLKENSHVQPFCEIVFKRFSGIQWNFEICFRRLVLLEKISFDKIFEAVTQKSAMRCKKFWYNNFLSETEKMKFEVHKLEAKAYVF